MSFDLNTGEITGLLGLNGAGKSTALSLLSGRLLPDHGEILFQGNSLSGGPHGPNQIGYIPEGAPLFDDLTVAVHLETLGGLYGMNKADTKSSISAVLDQFELSSVRGKRIAALSKGFRRRVALAGAFLTRPALLFLDEPTDGLDPMQKARMLDQLRAAKSDHTLLICTHSLEDVAALCDRVLVLHQGRLVFDDTLDAFRARGGEDGIEQAFVELVGAEAG